ncbi:uncharacterized protein N7458_006497 [Penicillium daleae]|uniref:Uncharacterized protein n=1 Tax=Penicillium daleae TaxID=63821 RepID=A0AAD6C4F4_9EURO|nr:uncharacterized protein N7458_006497 [Penicillium daleae]KAJ5450048.1 hypothetical protein N7458_006497 [Penicillium daleae]
MASLILHSQTSSIEICNTVEIPRHEQVSEWSGSGRLANQRPDAPAVPREITHRNGSAAKKLGFESGPFGSPFLPARQSGID